MTKLSDSDGGTQEDVIRQLSREAAEAGDLEMVAICERALAGDELALEKCARAIENTQAMDD